jgi:SNF2 family DNA or RNA helicase
MADLTPWPDGLTLQPWRHQHAAYDFLGRLWYNGQPGTALFSGMGTGKSLVAVALWQAFGFRRVLIVAPSSMVEEWSNIIGRASIDLVGVPLVGTIQERAEVLDWWKNSRQQFAAVTNYEAFIREPLRSAILDQRWDCVILDESQRVKSPGGKASKLATLLGRQTPYRLAMTGTPLHDKPLDAYAQYRFIDPRIFGTRYEDYKQRYALWQQGRHGPVCVGYQNQEELSERMYTVAFRVTEDVLDLPPLIESDRWVRLNPQTREAYDSFRRDAVFDNGEAETVAGNILTKRLRLQQITSGYLTATHAKSGQPFEVQIGTEKADALVELLADIPRDEPVVVFARFTHDLNEIRRVCHAQQRRYHEQSGRSDGWRRWRDAARFDPDVGAVLGVQIQSGNAGIDLTNASYGVFYSHGESLGNFQQAIRRLHRPGQTKTTRIYHILASDSIDLDIRRALREKRDVNAYVVDRLREGTA